MRRHETITQQQADLLAVLAKDILLHRQLPSGGWYADDNTVNGRTANSLLDKGWITPVPRETTGHRASYRITSDGRCELERLAKVRTLTATEFEMLTGMQRGSTLLRYVAEGEWTQGGVPADAAVIAGLIEKRYITIDRSRETLQRSAYMLTAAGAAALEATHGDKD